jgi:hypothetical protein
MEQVQKPSNSECYTPSSEPCRSNVFAVIVYVADIITLQGHIYPSVYGLTAAMSLKSTVYHSILKIPSKYKSKMVL